MTAGRAASKTRRSTRDMTHGGGTTPAEPDRRERAGQFLQNAAFVLLMATLAGRVFLNEMNFRISPLQWPTEPVAADGGGGNQPILFDRTEIARVTFAAMLLFAAALWALGGAVRGRLTVRRTWLIWAILLFGAASLLSSAGASDKRTAHLVWLEHISLLSACFIAVQLCSSERAGRARFTLLVIVLSALAATLAVKGLWQVLVEIPETIRHFDSQGATGMAGPPGSLKARLFKARLRSSTATGFFSLSNVFASLMIVVSFAAAGLVIDKLRSAFRDRLTWRTSRGRGEVHLPTLATVLSAVAAVVAAVVLVITRSRGGIIAAGVFALVVVGVLWFRRPLARHWRKCLLSAGVLFVLSIAAVAGFGLARDRLPSKTMTYRWHYWTASAEIVADNSLLGVGPGNFPSPYLLYRRPEAQEEVKTPHNVILHALTQYGIAGGACYLAILACVLVGICRPRAKPQAVPDATNSQPPPGVAPPAVSQSTPGATPLAVSRLLPATFLAVIAAATVSRAILADTAGIAGTVLMDAVLSVFVLGVMLLLAAWTGRSFFGVGARGRNDSADTAGAGSASRIALACGLGAFVLHNMVTFSLWMPAAATLFWISAGACLARAGGGRRRTLRASSMPIAVAAVAAVVAALAIFVLPVYRRARLSESVVRELHRRNISGAVRLAEQAAESDPLDPIASADAAKLSLWLAKRGDDPVARAAIDRAARWAQEATRRNPDNFATWRLRGRVGWLNRHRDGGGAALDDMARAISLNPRDHRLRVEYARMLCEAGRGAECLDQLGVALEIDRRINEFARRFGPEKSVNCFTDAERAEIKTFRARAEAMMGSSNQKSVGRGYHGTLLTAKGCSHWKASFSYRLAPLDEAPSLLQV